MAEVFPYLTEFLLPCLKKNMSSHKLNTKITIELKCGIFGGSERTQNHPHLGSPEQTKYEGGKNSNKQKSPALVKKIPNKK